MTSPAPSLTDIASKLDTLLALQATPQRYLSVRDTAAYCGLSADSVRRMLSSGKVRRLRPVPGCIRVDRIELEDYLASTADGCLVGGRGRRRKEKCSAGS